MRKGFVLMVAKWTFYGERGSQSTQNSPSSLNTLNTPNTPNTPSNQFSDFRFHLSDFTFPFSVPLTFLSGRWQVSCPGRACRCVSSRGWSVCVSIRLEW